MRIKNRRMLMAPQHATTAEISRHAGCDLARQLRYSVSTLDCEARKWKGRGPECSRFGNCQATDRSSTGKVTLSR